MAVSYNYKKGVDTPVWEWLSFLPPGSNGPGAGNAYDGVRYMYWAVQTGSTTATTATTSQLWRYDTWTNGWQFLATLTSGNQGMDVEYDVVRNLVLVSIGAAGTAWQVFNLNTTAVTYCNQSCAAWALTTITLVLPAAAGQGASLTMPDDTSSIGTLASNGATALDTGTASSASTSTSIIDTLAGKTAGTYGYGMVGLYVRFTSGALAGQRRVITAITSPTTLATAAFGGAPAAGNTFVVELPEGTATSGTTTTLTDTGAAWTTNQYRDQDVVIIAGTGIGQRRRIASNTGTVLTLSAAVTGNARTGAFGTAPDATSVYRIVPSSDFLYFQPGSTSGALYRIDVVQTTGAAWSASLGTSPAAPGAGSNTFYPGLFDPFGILLVRGAATSTVYRWHNGLQVWTTPLTVFAGSETFSTGATSAMCHGKRRLFIQKEASQRCALLDLTTGILEPGPFIPYAAPTAVEGHRARFVRSVDGVEWVYLLRAGGQEFLRVPLEWL